jgi:hypothetical protein
MYGMFFDAAVLNGIKCYRQVREEDSKDQEQVYHKSD